MPADTTVPLTIRVSRGTHHELDRLAAELRLSRSMTGTLLLAAALHNPEVRGTFAALAGGRASGRTLRT